MIRNNNPMAARSVVALVTGALLCGPIGGQTESAASAEEQQATEEMDSLGRVVKRSSASGFSRSETYNAQGKRIRVQTEYDDGRVVVRHELRDADGEAVGYALGLTDAEFESYLTRLGLAQDVSVPMKESWDGGNRFRSFQWGSTSEDGGEGWSHVEAELYGREMEVVRTEEGGSVVRVSDDWGAVRIEKRGELPYYRSSHGVEAGPSVLSAEDLLGPVAQMYTDAQGNPREVVFGETLLVRYHYGAEELRNAPTIGEAWEKVWFEVVDLRSGERALDSRDVPPAARPVFELKHRGRVYVESSVDGMLFGAVESPVGEIHALIPLEGGEVWRRVEIGGTDLDVFRTRTDYTEDLVRITFFVPNLVVEAPRSGRSDTPFAVLHPLEAVPQPSRDSAAVRGASGTGETLALVWSVSAGDCQYDSCVTAPAPPPQPLFPVTIGGTNRRPGAGPNHRPGPGGNGQGNSQWSGPWTEDEDTKIGDAVAAALGQVTSASCKNLFAADASAANPSGFSPGLWADPEAILNQANFTRGSGGNCDGETAAHTHPTASGTTPTIYLCKLFFDRRRFTSGSYSYSRANVLVHEARHVAGAEHTSSQESIDAYNQALAAAC